MSVTLEVSKLVKSKLVRLRQPSNILDIAVTLEVSKLVKSRWVRLPQLLNTPYMSVTAEVSKQDRSRPVRLLQPANMPLICVTLEVTKQFPKLIVSPNVLNYLVENFGIAPITTPEEDLKQLLK